MDITFFNALPDWVCFHEINGGKIIEINEAALKRTGYFREELIGKPIYDFYYDPKDREKGLAFCKRVLKEGTGIFLVTFRDKSGNPIEIEKHGSIFHHEGKKTLLVVARDIGEKLRDQRRALTFYEGFKRSNDVMFYCDRNGTILDVNDAFTKHYGYTLKEALGKTPKLLQSRHSTKEFYQHMWAAILDPKKGFWHGQLINRGKDGREVPVILTITAVRDKAGEIVGYISNAIDMRDQLALQARVADAEALATIGEMVAVVAHEIRNPLGSIVMAAKQLVGGTLAPEDKDMVLQVLRSESQRLDGALTNFLAYARPREVRIQRGDLNAMVAEVCSMVSSNPDLIKGSKVEVSLSSGLQPFPMDSDQVRQVLWNILLNAVQAMDGKGEISVRTGRDGGHAFFRIKDSGPGIPADKLAAIFKPFHTTKQQGTGLGLAIADRIVKAHGGRIEVESEGRGAAFCVYLPSVEG